MGAAGIDLLVDPGAEARGVRIAFSDRRGGTSPPPWHSLNLSSRSGDDPARVSANLARAARAGGFDPDDLVLVRQVHGAEVHEVGREPARGMVPADGVILRRPGPAAVVLTADCVPVVVAGRAGVAVVHAGWRGLARGIVERAVAAVGPPWGAWVGPCIRACCYEVGPEVVAAFRDRGLPTAAEGRVDPGAAAEHALLRAGAARVALADECASCNEGFFSHRRDGVTGRQGAFAALLEAV